VAHPQIRVAHSCAGCPVHTRSLRMSGEEDAQGSTFPSREPTNLPQPRILLFRSHRSPRPNPQDKPYSNPCRAARSWNAFPRSALSATLPESPKVNVLSSRRPSLTVMRRMARQTLGGEGVIGYGETFLLQEIPRQSVGSALRFFNRPLNHLMTTAIMAAPPPPGSRYFRLATGFSRTQVHPLTTYPQSVTLLTWTGLS